MRYLIFTQLIQLLRNSSYVQQRRWRATSILFSTLTLLLVASGSGMTFSKDSVPFFTQPTVYAAPLEELTPPALANISLITAGEFHACALTMAGGVKCWGRNLYGQLGDDTKTDRTTPVNVLTLAAGVNAIAAGSSHTCALTTSGGIHCWGRNNQGQLGNGSTANSSTPVPVSTLASGVSAIAAGWEHTCALVNSGVQCWGNNEYGQLGDNTTDDHNTPIAVAGLSSGVSAIEAGEFHTCALTTAGGVKCWGRNQFGQLGNSSTSSSMVPVDVATLATGVTQLAMGREHSCALMNSGGVKCWGRNSTGQLGNGNRTSKNTPVDVIDFAAGAVAVAAGDQHVCAKTPNGGAQCWGMNLAGQLGNGETTDSYTPIAVSTLTTNVATITAGSLYSCATLTDGSAKCWGRSSYGQLGNGALDSMSTPVNVLDTTPIAVDDATTIDEDISVAIAILANDITFNESLDHRSILITDGAQHGTTGTNYDTGAITYTPDANYFGEDSFRYQVCNSNTKTLCATAEVILTINAVNDAPTAHPQTVTLNADTEAVISLTGSDIDGDQLTYHIITQPQQGTLIGTPPLVTYRPNSGYIGTDPFEFRVHDGTTDSAATTVTIKVADPQEGAEDTTSLIGKVLTYSHLNRTSTPPYATKGTYTLRFNFTNNSGKALHNLFYQVADASNGFLLNTDDGTPRGTGATITIPNSALPGNDGIYQINELLSGQEYVIGVSGAPWRVRMAIYAVPQVSSQATNRSTHSPAQLLDYITIDSEQLPTAGEAIYLPIILQDNSVE